MNFISNSAQNKSVKGKGRASRQFALEKNKHYGNLQASNEEANYEASDKIISYLIMLEGWYMLKEDSRNAELKQHTC